jgi:hypothetical protein
MHLSCTISVPGFNLIRLFRLFQKNGGTLTFWLSWLDSYFNLKRSYEVLLDYKNWEVMKLRGCYSVRDCVTPLWNIRWRDVTASVVFFADEIFTINVGSHLGIYCWFCMPEYCEFHYSADQSTDRHILLFCSISIRMYTTYLIQT